MKSTGDKVDAMTSAEATSTTSSRTYGKATLPWIMFAALMGWNLYQISIHAMWRDELHSWLIASTSDSFSELIENTRWEGHPLVWYICLWLASKVSNTPLMMKGLHYLLAFGSSLLIMLRSPFPMTTRLLVVAGYFFSFEYLLISRNYAPGVLLIFVLLSFYEFFIERPLACALLLAILANTSMYGAIVSLAVATGIVLDLVLQRRNELAGRHGTYVASVLVYACGLLACYLTVKRSVMGRLVSDAGFMTALPHLLRDGEHNLATVIPELVRALVPIPKMSVNFWNTSIFDLPGASLLAYPLLIAVVVLVGLALRGTLIGSAVITVCFATTIVFNALFFPRVSPRHNGMVFICMIACAWLGRQAWQSSRPRSEAGSGLNRAAFTVLLLLNLAAALVAHYHHAIHPFSNGWSIARIMKSPPYNNAVPYVGYPDTMVTTVTGYLGKPFYYPSNDAFMQYYPKWGTHMQLSPADAVVYAKSVSSNLNRPVFFVTTMPFSDPQMELVAKTEGAIVKDEDFYLYLLDDHNRLQP
jgi:hypothetical protein